MEETQFSITIHMVMSLDGFIAKKDKTVSWFDTSCNYENGNDFINSEEFLQSIDCYVMGSNTYEFAKELSLQYGWPYGNTATIVVSSRVLQSDRANIEFYSGELHTLVIEKLKPNFKNVWVVGGATLASEFIKQDLVDEIRLNILPIILGDGLPVFKGILKEQKLELKDTLVYKNGLVELSYRICN